MQNKWSSPFGVSDDLLAIRSAMGGDLDLFVVLLASALDVMAVDPATLDRSGFAGLTVTPVTVAEIAQRTAMSEPRVADLLATLAERRFVRHKGDGRFAATREGLRLLDGISRHIC